jgi:hypothetical protein
MATVPSSKVIAPSVKHRFFAGSQYSRLGNRSYRPLPLRSAFLSTLKPFLEVVGDPFVRFHFTFKGSDIFYMAVRPLGREVPNVVHGVRYLQGWNFGRRLGRHGVFANSSFNAPGLHGLSDVPGNRALPRVLSFQTRRRSQAFQH